MWDLWNMWGTTNIEIIIRGIGDYMNKNAFITKDEYNNIKSVSLNFNEISQKYFSEKEFNLLNFQKVLNLGASEGGSFANYSSFASWYDGEEQVKIAQEKSLRIMKDWDELIKRGIKLRSDYVFLGVNAGAKGFDKKIEFGEETFDHFEMFQLRTITNHNGKSSGIPCAFKYQRAFTTYNETYKEFFNENIRGSYMTDFVKGLPTNFGSDITKQLKEISEKLKYKEDEYESLFSRFSMAFGEILKNELRLLGDRTHTLIVMGDKGSIVNKLIEKSNLNEMYKVENIPHYSGTPTYESLRIILKEIYDKNS